MAELDDRFVKRGYWVDWSKGSIMGQTFTVEAQAGTVIVALLTILASVATAQLWNLLTFGLHQWRARGTLSEGHFWQQQILLRTMPTPTAFLADSLKISWRWRSEVPNSLLRSLPILAFSILFAIGSIAAGISTSYAVDNSNIEVLVDSPFCGRINNTKVYAGGQQGVNVLAVHGDNVQSYAESCYYNNASFPAICRNTFHRPNITFSAEPVSCPWNETMCSGQGSSAVVMDSGIIDLRTHFGLNVEEKDSVSFRRKTTCNVLPREGHVFERPPEYLNRGLNATRWTLEYGTWKGVPADKRPEVTFNLQSILVENQMSFFTTGMTAYAHSDSVSGSVTPLPEMNRTDADVALIAVWPNAVVYENPVEDPLFGAHQVEMRQQSSGKDKALYWSDFHAGVVGCALQFQFCYPRAGQEDYCTDLGPSPVPGSPNSIYPDITPVQASILTLLRNLIRLSEITRSPQLGNLRAAKTLNVGISHGLPADQWIQEVVGWESFVWSGYQTFLSASVIGPKVFDTTGDEYRDAPTDAGDQQFCQSLRMKKAGGFANINVFALVFLAVFAIVLSLFNTLILRFCIFLSRFRQAFAPRVDRWVQDGIFQLQRRAFEAQDDGPWIDLEKEIPITESRKLLKELSLTENVRVERQKVGSFETGEIESVDGKEGNVVREKKSMSFGAEENIMEEKEGKGIRVSVGRVDTSATLVAGHVGGEGTELEPTKS